MILKTKIGNSCRNQAVNRKINFVEASFTIMYFPNFFELFMVG